MQDMFGRNQPYSANSLTLVLLNSVMHYQIMPNNVDLDQLASEEANWSGSAFFGIKDVNL